MSPSTDIIATCAASDKEGDYDHRHFKMYKPAKVLTQFKFTHRKRRNRILLGDVITDGALPCGVMAIGRLDEDSEGLLVLTTDGKVSEQVRRKSVEKEYYVQLDGQITQEAIDRLQSGVKISLPANNNKHAADNDDDESACESSTSPASTTYTTLPCRARVLDTVVIKIENKKTVAAPAKEEGKQPEEKKKQPREKGENLAERAIHASWPVIKQKTAVKIQSISQIQIVATMMMIRIMTTICSYS